jgi:hypothetical protein
VTPEAAASDGAVLVPVAPSASGLRLLDVALALAESEAPRVYALHVMRPTERGTLGANDPADEVAMHRRRAGAVASARPGARRRRPSGRRDQPRRLGSDL